MDNPAPLVGVPDAPVPPGGAAEWITGAGGLRLRAALFPVAGPARGSVVLSGGRTESIEKYFEVIDELRGRGFCVLVHDWRGQGLSGRLADNRLHGHATSVQDFLDDHRMLLDAFEDRLPKPWIALSHSMGACLTLLALARGERRIAGAALVSPMLGVFTAGVPQAVTRVLASAARALGGGDALTPNPSPNLESFDYNVLTHDVRRYARNQAQIAACPDLALGAPTWGWLDFAFKAMDELARGRGITQVQIPVVAVAAGDDRIVDLAAERRTMARLPKGTLIEVPGALHEILQETDELRAAFWRAFDALAAEVAPEA